MSKKQICENCNFWHTDDRLQENYGVNCGRCKVTLKITLCSQKGCIAYAEKEKEIYSKVVE